MSENGNAGWSHILNWTLERGSHEFPGPDGGTCINEAAIVAAGFEYRSIGHVGDMPPCFSPVIASYALVLNDEMPDDVRQRLLPYVGRLAGTADTEEVERRRGEYLAMQAVTVFAPPALERDGLGAHASLCRNATGIIEAKKAASEAHWAAAEAWTKPCGSWIARSAGALTIMRHVSEAADLSRAAARATVAALAAASAEAWDDALAALDGVLAIGLKCDTVPAPEVRERLDQARQGEEQHA